MQVETIRIVQADGELAAVAAKLFDQYRVFYGQPSDLFGAERFIRERLENGQSVVYIALSRSMTGAGETEAAEEEAAVGFTQLYPSFSSISMKRVWILNDLFVVPEARRLGAGKALIAAAKRLATDTGAKGLELCTAMDNYNAQRLYESVGFVRDEEYYRYFCKV